MNVQFIIVGGILIACVAYVVVRTYRNIKEAGRCKDYHCAGCPFYEKCGKKAKK